MFAVMDSEMTVRERDGSDLKGDRANKAIDLMLDVLKENGFRARGRVSFRDCSENGDWVRWE